MDMTVEGLKYAKPEPRKRAKRRERDTFADHVAAVRAYIFGRERGICRCCRLRKAESMHELTPRSLGGRISKKNSIAVCGQMGNGHECHGLLQAHKIVFGGGPNRAESTLLFTPITATAADWLRVKVGEQIESPPMRETDTLEDGL